MGKIYFCADIYNKLIQHLRTLFIKDKKQQIIQYRKLKTVLPYGTDVIQYFDVKLIFCKNWFYDIWLKEYTIHGIEHCICIIITNECEISNALR